MRAPELLRPIAALGGGATIDIGGQGPVRRVPAVLRCGIPGPHDALLLESHRSPEPPPVRHHRGIGRNLREAPVLNFDEGKQFFVRRIEFSGNTTTRDKVIRRELLIDEGDVYNTRLWELSILRLNQLGYFEALKAEDAADVKRDQKTSTVDLTLKVKERGKNSIQLNGGVSGISGSLRVLLRHQKPGRIRRDAEPVDHSRYRAV